VSIRLLLDMNLSPEWIAELDRYGYSAIHWSKVGDPRSPDAAIMGWARDNDYVVFTHDLDFGALLALTHADGPSVLQVRGQDVMPEDIATLVIAALRQHEPVLADGAIVVVDKRKARVRVLPL
jgi:predicted nuclease of predicted toxin-antitoxin system